MKINVLYILKTGAGMTVPYWDFFGSTIVTSNYVRLTPDDQSQSGSVWNQIVSIIFPGIIFYYSS